MTCPCGKPIVEPFSGKFIGCPQCRETPAEIIAEQVVKPIGAHEPFDMKETNYGLGSRPAVRRTRQRQEILDLLTGMSGHLYTKERTRCVSIDALRDVLTDWRLDIPGSIVYDMSQPGYRTLADVLHRAYQQASKGGKGHERHGTDDTPFEEQDSIGHVAPLFGVGYLLGQATKKAKESMVLEHAAAIKELLGAIVYLAGAVIHLEKSNGNPL